MPMNAAFGSNSGRCARSVSERTKSQTTRRPPGLRTRKISARPWRFRSSGRWCIISVLVTTSKDPAGEREGFDRRDPEVDGKIGPSRLGPCPRDLAGSRIDAGHPARRADAGCGLDGKGASATAHVQDGLPAAELREVEDPPSEAPHLAAQQEGVDEPHLQVV